MVSGRRPVRKDERVGLQIACCTYARVNLVVPFESASASRWGVTASPPNDCISGLKSSDIINNTFFLCCTELKAAPSNMSTASRYKIFCNDIDCFGARHRRNIIQHSLIVALYEQNPAELTDGGHHEAVFHGTTCASQVYGTNECWAATAVVGAAVAG